VKRRAKSQSSLERAVNGQKGERSDLVERIWREVDTLPGEHHDLRMTFVEARYAREMRHWQSQCVRYRDLYLLVTLGTAALGVISSGLVTATGGSSSTAASVVLVMIGVFVAVFAAVNHFLDPKQVAAEYKADEFELRRLGWVYLRQLEQGVEAEAAYADFRSATDSILKTQHGGSLGTGRLTSARSEGLGRTQ
jgi:hypothetical protein